MPFDTQHWYVYPPLVNVCPASNLVETLLEQVELKHCVAVVLMHVAAVRVPALHELTPDGVYPALQVG